VGRAELAAAIVGGGPAGVATALTLARTGLPVVLIERTDGSGNPIGESLPPSTNPLLQRLGLTETLAASRPLACHANRSSWGGDGRLVEHNFLSEPYGPGWHLDRPTFNRALFDFASDHAVICRRETRVQSATRSDNGRWQLTVATPERPETIEAGFIVDATGRGARIVRRLSQLSIFDRLTAAVATYVPTERPMEDSTTLIEATEHGWWYTALLPDGRLMVVFFSDADILARFGAWTHFGWTELLKASTVTADRIARHRYVLDRTPTMTAAFSAMRTPCTGEGWLAVGDAATTYDPLSSYGIGSALSSGLRAANAIVAHLDGDSRALSQYEGSLSQGYVRYLQLWKAYYNQERRWPSAPFWQRRHSSE
jgi:flavin-dependent dehydrogenase